MHNFSTIRVILALCALHSNDTWADASLGAYLDFDGWKVEHLQTFNAQAGKSIAIVNVFADLDQNWTHFHIPFSNIITNNAVPMLTWMPSIASRPKANLLVEITNGQWDGYIDDAIAKIKYWQGTYPVNKRPTLLLRFAHEFNGKWYPWGNSPSQYVAAWRHIHQRFSQADVTGVEWVWCANNVSVDDHNDITLYYPGNDVVDWTALDGYNWGSNYSFSKWASFSEVFSVAYNKLMMTWPDKPIMIAEVATAEPTDLPNPYWEQFGDNSDAGESKEAWIEDMFKRIRTEYLGIRAVVWTNTNKELNWAITGANNTGKFAYRLGVANSFYTSKFVSSKASIITNKKRYDFSPNVILKSGLHSTILPETVGQDKLAAEAAGFQGLSSFALEIRRYAHTGGQ